MTDWSADLDAALASQDPDMMKTMLARVPRDVLQRAVPYLYQLAKSHEADGQLEVALSYHEQLVLALPGQADRLHDKAKVLLQLQRFEEAIQDAEQITQIGKNNPLGYRLQGQIYEAQGAKARALACYRQALACAPDEISSTRSSALEIEIRKEALLQKTLNPEAELDGLQIEMPPLPKIEFDPALALDPAMPAGVDAFRIDGVRQHLWRYSGQVSPRNCLNRLEDTLWLAAWQQALASTEGANVLLHGSELGVFGVRALQAGAQQVWCLENYPLDARITGGIAQKHFLTQWHAKHGAAIQAWSEEQRRASFDEFAASIDIAVVNSEEANAARGDCFIFPQMDHSLLGTGLVLALQAYCERSGQAPARVIPASAKVYAQAVQWQYPGTDLQLQAVNRSRWNLYPQALELAPEFWQALSAPSLIGEIDFAQFAEKQWQCSLPATASGQLDAFIYWFELDLGGVIVTNAPGSTLTCIKPALQYTDPQAINEGEAIGFNVILTASRMLLASQTAASLPRSHALPSWYVPMLGDAQRNQAYHAALQAAHAIEPLQTVLDIGTGCGLLALQAVQVGAQQVVGCESNPAIFALAQQVLASNGGADKISLVAKDCRKLSVPQDLPERADVALFELFDCSLIGEGILHFLAYAREHLLKDNARYLPARAKLRAMLIEHRSEQIWGIDTNLLNPYKATTNFINVDANKLHYRALTAPFDVFDVEFASATPDAFEKEFRIPAIANGIVGAVLFWFDLGLDDEHWLSNAPEAPALHWKQGLQFMPEVRFAEGAELPLIAKHNGSGLKFQWQPEGIDKEALSKLPRFDPRWLAANGELEQQTQGLLQHCTQNAEEYRKVAEIAQRMALEPARYGLDAGIAQRFVGMFLGG